MTRTTFVFCIVLLLAGACASQTAQVPGPPADKTSPAAETPGEKEPREPTSEEVMYHVFAAEMLGSEGDLQGAAGEYLQAAILSIDPEIAQRATRVAFAAQSWQQASMAADRWALLEPDNSEAHQSAAIAMLASGDYSGAELHMESLLQLEEDKTQAWGLITMLLGRASSPEKSEKVLNNLLASQGALENADALYAQSQWVVRSGDIERAFQLAETAVSLEPDRPDLYSWAGRLALNMNRSDVGLEYFRRAWELDPENHDLALAYADLLARTGQLDEARKVMVAIKQTPDVMLTRVLFEISAGDREAALAIYEEFGGMEFEDEREKNYYLAQAAEAIGDPNRAIELFGRIETGEFALTANIRRAELMARGGDVEGALQVLAEMHMQSDEAVVEEAWLAQARILRQAGDKERAMASLGEALETMGYSVSIRYSHALLAAELGRVEAAEEDLRIILAEQPDNSAALNALGYTLADQTDRYEEAEELIKRAYTLQPNDASIVDSMGWVAFRLGRLEEAEEFLRRAWALEKNPEIAAHLGEVLWLAGKREDAISVWRAGLAVDPENPVLLDTMQRMEISL